MTVEYSPSNENSLPHVIFESRERRTVASYERELTKHRLTEIGLRELSPAKRRCLVKRTS